MYESYGCCIWEGYICALGLPYRGSPQPIAEGPIIAPGFVIPPWQAAKLAPYPYSADISHGDCTCPIWTGWSKGLDALSHWFIGLASGHPPTLSGETAPESNWFWISGCLPGPSAPWLGDASSTSASRFLLTGGPPSVPSVWISLIYPALCMFKVHDIGWIITSAQFTIPRGSKPTENSHKTIQHFLHFLINPLPN